MKKIVLLVLLATPAIMYCQNTHEISFRITDSVIVKKDYPYATKINLEISVPDFQNTFYLYSFPNYIDATDRLGYDNLSEDIKELYAPMLEKGMISLNFFESMGSNYVLEGENGKIIKIYFDFFNLLCREMPKGRRIPCDGIGTFINSKQKIIRKKINPKERLEYNFAKYEVNNSRQNISIYLLLSIYHKDLPKGVYWLYLTYSYNPAPNCYYQDIVNDSRTFKGKIVSNKVKLIVE